MSSTRRAVVTGAGGFIGRHLVKQLVSEGVQVHAIVRPGTTESPLTGCTFHELDLLNPGDTCRVLETAHPDTVFHLAAYGGRPGDIDRQRMFDVNVRASLNLWAALPPAVRFVMAGTSHEYAPASEAVTEQQACGPVSSYAATKHAAVTMLAARAREDGRPFVALRLYGVYGPGDTTERLIPFAVRRLLDDQDLELSAGDQRCDFTFVDDAVRALVASATAPLAGPAIFNVGGGICVTVRSVVERIASLIGGHSGKRLRFGAARRLPDAGVTVCANLDRARRVLAYEPEVSLEDGLRQTVEWHRQARSAAIV